MGKRRQEAGCTDLTQRLARVPVKSTISKASQRSRYSEKSNEVRYSFDDERKD